MIEVWKTRLQPDTKSVPWNQIRQAVGDKTMKRSIHCAALIAFLLGTASLASADVDVPKSINPRKKPVGSTTLRIATDEDVSQARLVIPRRLLQQLKAEINADEQEQIAETTTLATPGNAQTVMAGIFLSLAIVFGGVWVLRSKKQVGKLSGAQIGIALLVLGTATAGITYANAGPPPVARSLTSRILTPELRWWGAYGQVKIVITDADDDYRDEIRLIIPKVKDEKTK
jgi:hypothetical protein